MELPFSSKETVKGQIMKETIYGYLVEIDDHRQSRLNGNPK